MLPEVVVVLVKLKEKLDLKRIAYPDDHNLKPDQLMLNYFKDDK